MSTSVRKPSLPLVIAALVCGLLLYNAVEDLFSHLSSPTALVLLVLSAVLQWVLLRSNWAEISVWLPMILSTLCALLGAFIGLSKFHGDGYLLTAFAVPVYFGAAAIIVIAALLRLLRRKG